MQKSLFRIVYILGAIVLFIWTSIILSVRRLPTKSNVQKKT